MLRRTFLLSTAATAASTVLASVGCSNKDKQPETSPETSHQATNKTSTSAMPNTTNPSTTTRSFGPTVAGRFYTDNANSLRSEVRSYLDIAANTAATIPENQHIIAIVAPHAGYMYSGTVAGTAFASIPSTHAREINTVAILSPSHHASRPYVCSLPADSYRTPLGETPMARSLINSLMEKGDMVRNDEAIFRPEHAIDVEIPFIQLAFPSAQIIPLIVPMMSITRLEEFGRLLFETIGENPNSLVVTSTDLSHFFSYEKARAIDEAIVSELEQNNTKAAFEAHDERRGPCGIAPIIATWSYARYAAQKFQKTHAENSPFHVHRLAIKNSGDALPSGRDRVVGYCAMALTV